MTTYCPDHGQPLSRIPDGPRCEMCEAEAEAVAAMHEQRAPEIIQPSPWYEPHYAEMMADNARMKHALTCIGRVARGKMDSIAFTLIRDFVKDAIGDENEGEGRCLLIK